MILGLHLDGSDPRNQLENVVAALDEWVESYIWRRNRRGASTLPLFRCSAKRWPQPRDKNDTIRYADFARVDSFMDEVTLRIIDVVEERYSLKIWGKPNFSWVFGEVLHDYCAEIEECATGIRPLYRNKEYTSKLQGTVRSAIDRIERTYLPKDDAEQRVEFYERMKRKLAHFRHFQR